MIMVDFAFGATLLRRQCDFVRVDGFQLQRTRVGCFFFDMNLVFGSVYVREVRSLC